MTPLLAVALSRLPEIFAVSAVLAVALYVLVPQWWGRTFGYHDDRDPRWTRRLADKHLDELPPLTSDPLDEGWGKL